MFVNLCEWVGTVTSLIGALAIANKQPWGIPFFIVANVLFLVVARDRRTWGIFALQLAYIAINVRALFVWGWL